MLHISTEIASAAHHVGEEKAVELVAKAGFDAFDFSMFAMARYDYKNKCVKDIPHPLRERDYLSFARRLKQIGRDNGIYCNQSHAPFPVYSPEIRDLLKRALECTAEAGGRICIIHPNNYKTAEENAEMYAELLPFAKGCGVKMATENMWDWDKDKDESKFSACATSADFLAHIRAIDDPFLVACLDLGHAEMRGSGEGAPKMIRDLGSHLQALHIHDNDCWHDSHQIPFSMKMDFEAIARALKEVQYTGELTLEADAYLGKFTSETVADGLVNMANAAKRLAAMVEEA
jgi:sugar phosphate isomerase/epimerase